MPKRLTTIPSHTYQPTTDRNIMRFVDREGDWTHYWIKSKKMFVPAVNHIIKTGYPKGERFYSYLLSTQPDAAERKLRSAGEEGSRTHEAIRNLLEGKLVDVKTRFYHELTSRYEPLSPDEWDNLEAFAKWCAVYQPQVLISEHAVWSPTHLYAGTVDFIGSILVPENDKCFGKSSWGKRILVLLDWKTSGGIWDDYELQVAAYREAALETIFKNQPVPEFGSLWTGIVRLGTKHKSGFEMKVWNEEISDNNFRLFQSVLDIYDKKAGFEFKPEIRHIPSHFSLKIPRLRLKKTKAKKPPESEREDHMAEAATSAVTK
ncbi:MAG: hypothetical protein V4519_03515 [Patescibacteria group bacterium]